ncbi:Gfo/Idh/MocA family oxidoreductase [Pendulispora brunnea]|uniref:Gfo/Idh/MocA family oxidoreductase n=1 Tax=Pendulispora brunnea TaxID=2905690 RepID=A0ABZ2K5K4_9BACT
MRIGLAGVGRIGSFHANTLRQLPEVETLVLADVDAARAKQVAATVRGEALERPEDLFSGSARIDALVICTATDAHASLIVQGVEAGIPVFCEKPVAIDAGQTRQVLQRIQGARAPVHIGFQRRFDAGYMAARAAIQEGNLGWVHTLRACTFDVSPPPANYVPTSGGLFRDCSVHDFDILRWVTGREVVEVYAVGQNRGESFFRDAGDVDTNGALLTMDDGAIALVSATRYNAGGHDVRLEVLGSKASIAVGLDERTALRSVEPGITFPTGKPYPLFLDRFHDAYVRELEAFVDVVAGRRQSPCTVEDALSSLLIAEACEISRHQHRPVKMTEVTQ